MQSAPAWRISSSNRSSTAIPAEPYASKNAAWGLNTAVRSPMAATSPRAQASSPPTSDPSPHALSTAACGSIPTQRLPRSAVIAFSRRQ